MLDHYFFSEATSLYSEDDYWFQHDSSPVHYAEIVVKNLNRRLPERWIGRGGPIHWPPRSPDLTPLDFCFWHELRQLVLVDEHDTVDKIIGSVQRHVAGLLDVAQRACLGVKERMEKCLEHHGENVDKW